MPSIDVSKLPAAALKALRAGKPVQLTRDGKTIATLSAKPGQFTPAELARARKDLARVRRTERDDDWADYVQLPES
jgi:antitoxin (DNA-binding transcriptional repressor) of toxin-antitoxin stability system